LPSISWSTFQHCGFPVSYIILLLGILFSSFLCTCPNYRSLCTLRPLAHTPAFCQIWIRLRSWSVSHVPALPLPVASTDRVYVVSLILNAAQVRRANSNAVALKLISRPPARLPGARFVEFKSGTLSCRTGNWAGPARTDCV
jgi:hypothetical protein